MDGADLDEGTWVVRIFVEYGCYYTGSRSCRYRRTGGAQRQQFRHHDLVIRIWIRIVGQQLAEDRRVDIGDVDIIFSDRRRISNRQVQGRCVKAAVQVADLVRDAFCSRESIVWRVGVIAKMIDFHTTVRCSYGDRDARQDVLSIDLRNQEWCVAVGIGVVWQHIAGHWRIQLGHAHVIVGIRCVVRRRVQVFGDRDCYIRSISRSRRICDRIFKRWFTNEGRVGRRECDLSRCDVIDSQFANFYRRVIGIKHIDNRSVDNRHSIDFC